MCLILETIEAKFLCMFPTATAASEAPQRSSRDHRHVRIAAATVDSKAAQQTETLDIKKG